MPSSRTTAWVRSGQWGPEPATLGGLQLPKTTSEKESFWEWGRGGAVRAMSSTDYQGLRCALTPPWGLTALL